MKKKEEEEKEEGEEEIQGQIGAGLIEQIHGYCGGGRVSGGRGNKHEEISSEKEHGHEHSLPPKKHQLEKVHSPPEAHLSRSSTLHEPA